VKSKEAKPLVGRKSSKDDSARVRDLEKRLEEALRGKADALKREAEALEQFQTRDRELKEAQEQQTASGEILSVISSSQTDVLPVFDAIVRNGMRLTGAARCVLFGFDGRTLSVLAMHNVRPEGIETIHRIFPQPASRNSAMGRAVLDRTVVHIPDVMLDPQFGFPEAARTLDFRAVLAIPTLRKGDPIGAIVVHRSEPGAFSESQIQLLQTFADQAVIAIENVRLFKELEARNGDLSESLEQQTATGEILRVIASSPTEIEPVFAAVAESAARLCESSDADIWRRADDQLLLVAHYGAIPVGAVAEFGLPLVRGSVGGRSILEGRPIQVADVQAAADEFPESAENAWRTCFRTILSVPLMREGVAIGAIILRRTEARLFTERQVSLLQTFADQAVIAIENVRLFKELEARNRDLTATAEILQVISRSPTDVQPVLETVVENAVRLCEAERAFIFRFDGELLRAAASCNTSPELRAFIERNPISPGRRTAAGRVAMERRTVHIPDVQADPEYAWSVTEVEPLRTLLGVPMLKGSELASGCHRHPKTRSRPVHREADRARGNLRRPGGHRHRECAVVHGAGREEQGAHGRTCTGNGVAGTADGDRRGAEADQPIDLRSWARTRDADRARGAAVWGRRWLHLQKGRRAATAGRVLQHVARAP